MSKRNQLAAALLGSDLFSFPNNLSPQERSLTSLPPTVLDSQLGVAIFRPGNRYDLIDDFKEVLDFSNPYPGEKELINLVKQELSNYQNIFGLINSWNLYGHVYFQYPGSKTATRPKSPTDSFFLSTLVKIDINHFKYLASSFLPKIGMAKESSLGHLLEKLQRLYSKKEIINYALFDSVVDLDPVPLEVSFKSIPTKS
jgi:hypothetical protein